ncbi:MAG: ATP-dependent 6-phosphofructokinase [Thermoplasmata archaeon]|nr:ATP-dependent 6-phosphofructokinase [Thermoplasmata archaeon]MCI4359432.1 ATP-dependent 6-phosphofructokinase [Thermoplasmata archaeon]
MKFGVLTGGGDCPGLNAAVRAVVFRAHRGGHRTIGFLDGWKGVLEGQTRDLVPEDLADGILRGGTVLGTTRTNPFKTPEGSARVTDTLHRLGVEALVAIGGDDTLSAAQALHRLGGKVVGVPKTMDNDVGATDWTFGFDSAASVSMDALGRLRDTAASHHRALVLEVMGRNAGWVALATGLAGAADATLIPEEPFDEDALMGHVKKAIADRGFALVVASEGIELGPRKGTAGNQDDFDHELLKERRVGEEVARRIEAATGVESRSAAIGHIQRGGSPTLFDRILATRLGAKAVDLAVEGKFGQVAVLRGSEVVGVPFAEALRTPKTVPADWRDLLHTFEP